MNRRRFLKAALAAPFVHTRSRAAAARPNVVMFMTDDHGAWASRAYGCDQLTTPNIDVLAGGGARFTRAFACTPVCSPSRLTYLTGRLPSTHGVQDWLRPVDSFGEKTRRWLDGHATYSEVLARHGYTLGLSGKWHMGGDENAQAGFSWWATVPGGGGPYRDAEFVKNGKRAPTQGYKTDRVGDHALEFLDSRRGRDNPFYLLVPFYAPHTPYNYQPDEYRKPYEGSDFACFPRTEIHPWQNRGLRAHHVNQASMHAYSALITGLDANVGRVLRKLEEMGARENTLVVFTADQGWNAGHHGVWGKGNGTWPFNMYEESIQVPMIWNHPGKIGAGRVVTQMVSSYDYFPTILDYLGIDAGRDRKRVGRSYAPLVRGQSPRWDNRLYFEYSFVRAVRTENLKYIERTREWPSELYDLEADPGERRNLLDDPSYRGRLDALRADLGRFFRRAGAPPLEQWRSTTRQELTTYQR
jgi:arylsulfatase A-like enzyme